MLRCFQCGISIADLEKLSMGTVLDMFIESENDSYNYRQLATQADFDKW